MILSNYAIRFRVAVFVFAVILALAGASYLMRMIVPIRLDITSTDSTRKLAQNKTEAARISVADGLATSDIGSELSALAQMMREALD